MREHTFVRPGVIARLRRSPLGPYLDPLATSLHHEGYAPSSIQRFLCAAEPFAHWLHRQGYTVYEMEGPTSYTVISLDSPNTAPGTCPKPPKG